jgi:L-glyceraldehyde 3-phosphate reductase
VNTDGSIVVRKSEDYIPSMIEIAGGRYAFKNLKNVDSNAPSVKLTMEEFYATAVDADYLIYNGTIDGQVKSISEPESQGILNAVKENGSGFVAFSPLAQGLLTNRYLNGIPDDSRIARGGFLKKEALTPEVLSKIQALNERAAMRGQSLAEMALAWLLKNETVISVIVGASSVEQLGDSLKTLNHLSFEEEELHAIEKILM